jgi:hypothetical protein
MGYFPAGARRDDSFDGIACAICRANPAGMGPNPAADFGRKTTGPEPVKDGAEDASPHSTILEGDPSMDPKSLYDLDATDAVLAACGGNLGTGMETCVAYGPLPGADDVILLADTKLGDQSPLLRFTKAEIDNFIERFQADKGTTA